MTRDPVERIPGVQHVRTAPRAPLILKADALQKLGSAAGRTWFARDDGSEVRVDVEIPALALNDSFPQNRVVLHQVERVPDRSMIVGRPGEKGSRKVVRGHDIDRYWKCTVMPAGSFAAAHERDKAQPVRSPSSALREPTHPVKIGAANARSAAFWADLRAGRTPVWRVDER